MRRKDSWFEVSSRDKDLSIFRDPLLRKMDFFFCFGFNQASIVRLSLFNLRIFRFFSPYWIKSPRFSAIPRSFRNLFRFPVFFPHSFLSSLDWTKCWSCDHNLSITVHSALELQGKRLLAQEMSSMQPSFDTGTPAYYFGCTKKFNSGISGTRRFELRIMLSYNAIAIAAV